MSTQKNLIIKAYGASHTGRRGSNEDAYLVNEGLGLFIVADGMGGHDKGEVASWFASENLERSVAILDEREGHDTVYPFQDFAGGAGYDELLEYSILSINQRLFEANEKEIEKFYGAKPGPAEAEFAELVARKMRMGTTLVSLLIRGNRAYVTHVGDSRAYRMAGGGIQLLTADHSWVVEHLRSGELTPEEAKVHKKRNVITRSVGFKKDVAADIDVMTLIPSERFLLCSDGLSGVVHEDDILALAVRPDLKEACDELVDLALANGGRDNITAVLVDVLPEGPAEAWHPGDAGHVDQTEL